MGNNEPLIGKANKILGSLYILACHSEDIRDSPSWLLVWDTLLAHVWLSVSCKVCIGFEHFNYCNIILFLLFL